MSYEKIKNTDRLPESKTLNLFIEKVMSSNMARECKIIDVERRSKDIIFFTEDLTVENIYKFDEFTLKLMKDLEYIYTNDFCPILVSIKDKDGC